MSAEVEYYYLNSRKDVPEKTSVIQPGHVETANFFGPAVKLLISCGIDNLSSSVMIFVSSPKVIRNLQAVVYEDENDNSGKIVPLEDSLITIEKPQELSLFLGKGRRRKRFLKGVYVYWLSDNLGIEDEFPQETRPLVLA